MATHHISELLPTVIGNKELQKHESTERKTGDELALEKAISSPLICKSDMAGIANVLKLVMVKIGLRSQNWPTEEEKVVLIDHILTNFPGNRVEEIRLAFELAIAGKLDLREDEINCYENFSCIYVSKILNAYRRWALATYDQIKEPPPDQRIFSQEELEDGQREDAERQYQQLLRGQEIKFAEANRAILEKDGLIRDNERVIDFYSRKIDENAAHIYTRK